MPTVASISKTAVEYGKAMAQYPLFWYEEAGDPLRLPNCRQSSAKATPSAATGETCSRCRTRANPDPARRHARSRLALQFDCALSARSCRIPAARHVEGGGWSPGRCIPARRPPDVAGDCGRAGVSVATSAPICFQPYGGFPNGVRALTTVTSRCRRCRASVLKARERPDRRDARALAKCRSDTTTNWAQGGQAVARLQPR